MPRIIAYAYNAAHHCPDCTRSAFGSAEGVRTSLDDPMLDHNGVPDGGIEDAEGNPIWPVFAYDVDAWCSGEGSCYLTCDNCADTIREHTHCDTCTDTYDSEQCPNCTCDGGDGYEEARTCVCENCTASLEYANDVARGVRS